MSTHLKGLEDTFYGVNAVPTLAMEEVQAYGHRVIELGEMMAVYGEPGVGKTFSVESMLDTSTVPWARIELIETVTAPQFARLVGEAVLQTTPHGQSPQILAEVQDVLCAAPMVLWIDEAQHAPRSSIQRLRVMHFRPGARWTCVFSGFGIEDTLGSMPEVEDRMAAWLHVRPLTGTELLDALADYHEVFAATPDDLLLKVDQTWARGRWRRWGRILQHGLPLLRGAHADSFDEQTLGDVIEMVAKPRSLRKPRKRISAPFGQATLNAASDHLETTA